MGRADLTQLLGNLSAAPDVAGPLETAIAAPTIETDAALRQPPRDVSGGQPGPEYLTYLRKETRLRLDQHAALTVQARRLSRAKGNGGTRITENTLIRIAVDLLLSQAEQLAGGDEAELRQSAGLT